MARALCWATVLPPMTFVGYGIRAAVPRGLTRPGQIPVNVATGTGCTLVVVRGLPETDVARVQRWCRDRVPERVRLGTGEGEKLLRSPGTEGRLMPWRSSTSGSPWIRFFAGPGRAYALARNRGLSRAGRPARRDRSCPATAAYSSRARA